MPNGDHDKLIDQALAWAAEQLRTGGHIPFMVSNGAPAAGTLVASLTLSASGITFLAGFGAEAVVLLLQGLVARVPVSTLCNGEQGRRQLDPAARALLRAFHQPSRFHSGDARSRTIPACRRSLMRGSRRCEIQPATNRDDWARVGREGRSSMSYGPPEIEQTPPCPDCAARAVFRAVARPGQREQYSCAVASVAGSGPTSNSTSSPPPNEKGQ